MAQVDIGAAIGSGFGLMRRHPLSVITWGALPVLIQVASLLLFAPLFVALYAPYFAAAQTHTLPAPPNAAALGPQLVQMELGLQLVNLIQLFVSAIVNCAVFRAVLHPERSAFAYLRLGVAELLTVALLFMALIAFFVITLLVLIPVGVVLGITIAATHGSAAVMAILLPVILLVLLLAGVFLALRFSVAGPMIVDDNKFHLFDAWVLTRGHFWSMFAVGVSLVLIGLAAELLFLIVAIAAAGASLAAIAGGLANVQSLFALPPSQLLGRVAPVLAVYLVLAIPLAGAAVAFFSAPWARILRDLQPTAAEVFA